MLRARRAAGSAVAARSAEQRVGIGATVAVADSIRIVEQVANWSPPLVLVVRLSNKKPGCWLRPGKFSRDSRLGFETAPNRLLSEAFRPIS